MMKYLLAAAVAVFPSIAFGSDLGAGVCVACPATDISGKVSKTGDTMTGQLTLSGSTLTVTGNAFSVGISTLIVSNGNVGIGTDVPSEMLQIQDGNVLIKSATSGAITVDRGAASNFALLNLKTNGLVRWAIGMRNDATDDLSFFEEVNGVAPLKLHRAAGGLSSFIGKVGIGTANPAQKLHLSSGTILIDGDSTTAFQIGTSSLIVTSDGQLGILNAAGTGPQYRLDVGNLSYFAINGNFAHIIQHNSAASEFWSIATRNGGDLDFAVTTTDPRPTSGTIGTSGNAISIKTNKDVQFLGNVAIGNFTAVIDLAVGDTDTGLNQNGDGVLDITANGTVAASAKTDGSNIRFFIPGVDDDAAENPVCRSAAGELSRGSGGCNVSSIRYKQNIRDLNYGLTEVMRLRPIAYERKTSPERTQFGLSAEAVKKIFPEIIHYEPYDPTLVQTYDYRGMHAVLVNAIQEQQKQIEEFKKRIANLESSPTP